MVISGRGRLYDNLQGKVGELFLCGTDRIQTRTAMKRAKNPPAAGEDGRKEGRGGKEEEEGRERDGGGARGGGGEGEARGKEETKGKERKLFMRSWARSQRCVSQRSGAKTQHWPDKAGS